MIPYRFSTTEQLNAQQQADYGTQLNDICQFLLYDAEQFYGRSSTLIAGSQTAWTRPCTSCPSGTGGFC